MLAPALKPPPFIICSQCGLRVYDSHFHHTAPPKLHRTGLRLFQNCPPQAGDLQFRQHREQSKTGFIPGVIRLRAADGPADVSHRIMAVIGATSASCASSNVIRSLSNEPISGVQPLWLSGPLQAAFAISRINAASLKMAKRIGNRHASETSGPIATYCFANSTKRAARTPPLPQCRVLQIFNASTASTTGSPKAAPTAA